ncbi:MAG: nucleoside-diphosphate sugar epimerase/dehydratase, partial [Bryobacteraceae bacterium]
RMLLYGAGNSGILLARDVKHSTAVKIVGFLDDDPRKAASVIAGTRVLGGGDSIEKIVHQHRVDEVVITMASPPADLLRRVLEKCREVSVPLKIIPDVQKILLGHASIGQIQDIRLEDLLGRECVDVTRHENTIRQVYSGKRILVTGAGGSIGSELVRQLVLFEPQSVTLLDKDENSVYELQQELLHKFPEALFEPRVADIRQAERLNAIFRECKPQIVFHAAAHKHVPLMECNPCEAILNNVLGTEVLLQVCREWDVEQFVYISSDKAVYPSNVMGATKRIGELMVRSFAEDGGLRAACVRFGNVLGSRGSVIPLFQKQIARGGPITVTHPEITRYFMTIPEAVRLVLCAGTLGIAGETFVLDMGVPRKILDIAHEMIALAGLRPEQIEVKITGLRSGEKLYEELVESTEALQSTNVEKLWKVASNGQNKNFSLGSIAQLINAARQNDRSRVYEQLFHLGIGFQADTTEFDFPVHLAPSVPSYLSAAASGSINER